MTVHFPSLPEIESQLEDPRLQDMPPLKIAVLRNVTMEPIEPYLRYVAYQNKWNAKIKFGDFDNLIQEALGDTPLLFCKALDVVLVFSLLEQLSTHISSCFTSLSAEGLEKEVGRISEYFQAAIQGIRRQTDAMILWHGIETPLYPAFGIYDPQMRRGQTETVAGLNSILRETLSKVPNAYFVDMDNCRARIGGSEFYDSRFWHIARIPYSRKSFANIAAEDFQFIKALKGRMKKCLVLDCDNTLWGGVVGEDGLNGIKLGHNYPGSAFLDFQREVVSLFHRGVIIALCSKNNEEDVWEVFEKHPDMLLKREHIAAARINWNDKSSNLKELSTELNIGIDSFVFADDSDFEVGLIRDRLPELGFIHLNKEKPLEYKQQLLQCGFFDAISFTEEDRNRGKAYFSEASRRQMRNNAEDLEGYYSSLQMKLEIGRADEFTIPRIAQLCQKTNQFNLTTRRYTEADIHQFSMSPKCDVFWIRVSDKFGDLGIVGACILRYGERQVLVDTLLLSCRTLGRGIEKKFLEEALNAAHLKGAKLAVGEYVKTQKNSQTAGFYLDQGFHETLGENDGDRKTFQKDISAFPTPQQGYFAEIDRSRLNANINA